MQLRHGDDSARVVSLLRGSGGVALGMRLARPVDLDWSMAGAPHTALPQSPPQQQQQPKPPQQQEEGGGAMPSAMPSASEAASGPEAGAPAALEPVANSQAL